MQWLCNNTQPKHSAIIITITVHKSWPFRIPNPWSRAPSSVFRGTENIWISNPTGNKVWDEIIYPFSNFNGCTIYIWEWISNFTHGLWWCSYLSVLWLKLNHVSEMGTWLVLLWNLIHEAKICWGCHWGKRIIAPILTRQNITKIKQLETAYIHCNSWAALLF